MQRLLRVALAATCLTVVLPAHSHADSINLAATKDNTLYESVSGGVSNGAGKYFFAGSTVQGALRRGVIHFNVAGAIPAGSVITQVTLTLFMSKTQATLGGPTTVSVHRCQREWGEGASDAPSEEGQGTVATTGDATWLHTHFNMDLWTTTGGDFFAAASGATVVDGVAFYSWSSQGMIDVVQGWVDDPATNFGWVLLGDERAIATAKRFDTRENPTTGNRPVLSVSFEAPLPVEESTWGGIKALYEN